MHSSRDQALDFMRCSSRKGSGCCGLMLMVNFGCFLIATSYMRSMWLRALLLCAAIALWGILVWKFQSVQLWGAALQGCVVVTFSAVALFRRIVDHRKVANHARSQASRS